MKMPGFTADVSVLPTSSHYRMGSASFTSSDSILPQLDSVIFQETYEEDGHTVRVTVTKSTAFDPDEVPSFFEGFGSGTELGVGKGKDSLESLLAKARRCRDQCFRVYNGKRLACAIDEDPRGCEYAAFDRYLDCYGECSPWWER
jgi:hypothetical protein